MARIKRDIIDNVTDSVTLKDVLNSEIPHTEKLDISTGYFDVPGYAMLRGTLEKVLDHNGFFMRLLLGTQALVSETTFEETAKRSQWSENDGTVPLKSSVDDAELTADTMSDIVSLIAFLRHENVQVRIGGRRFNHSKCYITDDSVFIGSSNMTAGGLVGNYELNAGLYQPGVSDTTRRWFERMWDMSEDAKQQLIQLLESSKFGVPANPYDVYIKMIFERYRDILAPDTEEPQYNIELTKFQRDAVRTALFIMSEFQGAMIADATGLGKTNMGMEILRQKILKENRKVLLIAPSQVLRSMWDKKLREAGLSVRKQVTMESLGSDDALSKTYEYKNIDFVLIDESQNFRSKNAKRSQNLAKIMTLGKQKQSLLLSATPINNSIMDLYYQLSILTRRNDQYFWRSIGIPDLYQHMRDAANKEGGLTAGLEKIQRLLDAVMVRRTRSYIREVYPDDTINGHPIKFPKHEYAPIHYSLADLYGNVFQRILEDVHNLTMAPYGPDQYDLSISEEERQKHRVLAHLQVILLLKRFESSVTAVKISINNKIRLYEYVKKVTESGRMVSIRDLNRIITKGTHIANRNDTLGAADVDFDMDEFLLSELEKMESEEIGEDYDMERFSADLQKDLQIFEGLRDEIGRVTADKKLESVRDTILKERVLDSESKKILIFTEYTATAKYLLHELRKMMPRQTSIECITGDTKADIRARYMERFAPESNLADDQRLDGEQIDILISTEVLAEGQNLQDCNYVINYDLPWNPMRIVQRIGRVDRLTSKYETIHSRACYPDKELDGILELMGKLLNKIQTVNQVIGLDAELLGETPTPHQYNGHLKDRLKILGAKGSAASDVIVQMERDSDLMPQNTPLNEIARRAKQIGIDELRAMPMGRRSGKAGTGNKCILAYVRQRPERYVYFVIYDYETGKAYVPDNEYDAVNEAKCVPEELTYLPMDKEDETNSESFTQLLKIDKEARDAIRASDEQVKRYVTNARNKSYDNIRKRIKSILSNAFKAGRVDAERLGRIQTITNRVELLTWESRLKDTIEQYEDGGDVNLFIEGIEMIGKDIGVQEETVSEGEIDYDSMKLVGAMFITAQDAKGVKSGLDAHVSTTK